MGKGARNRMERAEKHGQEAGQLADGEGHPAGVGWSAAVDSAWDRNRLGCVGIASGVHQRVCVITVLGIPTTLGTTDG